MSKLKSGYIFAAASIIFAAIFVSIAAFTGFVRAEVAQTDVSLSIQPVISISTTEDLVFNFAPTNDPIFSAQNIEISVETNNATGYTLYMSSKTEETALVNTSVSSRKITSTAASSSSSDMSANTWGYSLNENDYLPIPPSVSPDILKKTTESLNNIDTTNIKVGVKVDNHLVSGAYKNTLLFTAITNDGDGGCPENDIFCITRMQEMTPEICSNTTTPSISAYGYNYPYKDNDGSHRGDNTYIPEVTLVDIRDNTTYLVRKAADGNCWMTQNLHLKGPLTLTAANTDLNGVASFTLPASNAIGDRWADDDTAPHVIEPINDPQFQNQDGTYWNPQYINYTQPADTGTPQQHRGNYYTWQAATAGSGSAATAEGAIATSSICPKGWQLPNDSGAQSIYNFIATYGPNPNQVAGNFLYYTPFEMFLFGKYYTHMGGLDSLGFNGVYWTNTASAYNSSKTAYTTTFGERFVYTHYQDGRDDGFSIRCVARPAGN